jgi:hypothetical protein
MSDVVYQVKPLVVAALRESALARDLDNALILDVWQRCGLRVAGEIHQLAAELPHVETIRRHRARIQNIEGRFPPSPNVLARRQRHSRRRKDKA